MDDQHTILDQTYVILMGTYLSNKNALKTKETISIKGNTLEIYVNSISECNKVVAAYNNTEKGKCKALISINWVSLLIVLNNALKL